MIRSLRLTDIAALLLFLGKSPVDEARTRDKLISKRGDLLSAILLLQGCLISEGRQHSLIYHHRGLIRGLVCLRRCRGPTAWIIEHLLLAPGHESFCVDLLERLSFAGAQMRAERIFLRLDYPSPSVDMAKQAGFNHYLTEFLYCLEGVRQAELSASSLILRPKCGADEHGLFRLYSAATPLQVRSAEGMTLQEWQEGRGRDTSRELVFESRGEVSALLRIRQNRMAGEFDMVTELGPVELGQLVNYSLAMLKGRRPIYCLAFEFQQQLRRVLEEQGFSQVAAYACLSKQLAVRVHEPQLVPLRA